MIHDSPPLDWRRDDGFEISTDADRLDREAIHRFLSRESYWAAERSRDVVDRSIDQSLPFGLYAPEAGPMAGFGRVVTDFSTFAWIADVFVLEEWRGRGLGTWLIGTILAHPRLVETSRWLLGTKDAHGLYALFGFQDTDPGRYMVRTPRTTGC